jgi:hypothetical protein
MQPLTIGRAREGARTGRWIVLFRAGSPPDTAMGQLT